MSKKAKTRRGVRKRRRLRRAPTKAQAAAALRNTLNPHYGVECYYRGFDMALDRKLRKLVGRAGDSGMSLWLGLRDLSFRFTTEPAAVAAAKRVKAAKIRGVRVMLRGFWRA